MGGVRWDQSTEAAQGLEGLEDKRTSDSSKEALGLKQ
jgi:hypothetical protein